MDLGTGCVSYILIIFCPPLYFLIQGRILAFLINGFLYSLALLTIIFGIGFFFWFLAMVHGAFDLRSRIMEEFASTQARKIAEEMAKSGFVGRPQPVAEISIVKPLPLECKSCGQKLLEDSRYCEYCGKPVEFRS